MDMDMGTENENKYYSWLKIRIILKILNKIEVENNLIKVLKNLNETFKYLKNIDVTLIGKYFNLITRLKNFLLYWIYIFIKHTYYICHVNNNH